jgi:phage major head subunit gpT-like protein
MAQLKPLYQFGGSTQRALEEFRLEYNSVLASMPSVWADSVCDVLSGNSLIDTLPIALDLQKWRERKGEHNATDLKSKDISIVKRMFASAAQAQAIKIQRGDHAYIQQWMKRPAAMARGRMFMRNHLVADLIETGESANTCAYDGKAFFATDHPVNPFDANVTYAGSASWANFVSASTPLDATSLSAQKTAFRKQPGPDGEEMGLEADTLYVSTSEYETAYNLLKVQDLLLSGSLSGGGDGTMGQVRNPHFNSGLTIVRCPELSPTTGDWYLGDSKAYAQGVAPVLLSEDASEEMCQWDESSDFYKNTKMVKIESTIMLEAAFLFPHAFRKISGS